MRDFKHTDPDGDRISAGIHSTSNPDRLVGMLSTDSRDGQVAAVHLSREAVKRLRKTLKRALKEAR